MVTRKTLVGLKKHMEVCQKVRLPPVPGRGGGPGPAAHKRARLQLQDALKCQHCRKQFKSKAGLNYHTMAEHSAKVRHWAQLPSGPARWPLVCAPRTRAALPAGLSLAEPSGSRA